MALLLLVLAACKGSAAESGPGGGDSPGEACAPPRTLCGNACVDTSSAPAHCGACDNACSAVETCVDGACADSCPEGRLACAAGCVDPAKDEANCGACDTACAAGEVCSSGVCCPAGQTACDGACTPLLSSDAHCGACGNACGEGQVCRGGACTDVLPSCNAILQATPSARSGRYTVDVDGLGGASSFDVFCEMEGFGGGFTRVGKETAGVGGTLRFLGTESISPEDLLAGGSGLIGSRFAGKYTEVLITWQNEGLYIRFKPTVELFANEQALAAPVTDFDTNDARLADWVATNGGAAFCRAAVSPDIRPGHTSWAIKPASDLRSGCGCDNSGWLARGAFYSGSSTCTSCDCWGPGGFVGVKGEGELKAGITGYTTSIYVR